jgi:hypothetical protein
MDRPHAQLLPLLIDNRKRAMMNATANHPESSPDPT